jgi:hypothetical protein
MDDVYDQVRNFESRYAGLGHRSEDEYSLNFDHVKRWISPPQRYGFSTLCNKLLLVSAVWRNSSQARKVVEKRKRYRKERVDDREMLLAFWVIEAGTIHVSVDLQIETRSVPSFLKKGLKPPPAW